MAITRTQVLFYGRSTNVEADGCYSIAFFRPTASSVPIEAGQTLTIEQNVGDQDFTSYDIVFYPAGGSENELFVIKVMPVEASPNAGQPNIGQKSLNVSL